MKSKILLVGESRSYSEKKSGKLLLDRFGDLLKRMLEMAKIDKDQYEYDVIEDKMKLWDTIKTIKPVAIVALGTKVTSILTKTKASSLKMDLIAGSVHTPFGIPIVPLWSHKHLFNQNKDKCNDAIRILFSIKEKFLDVQY